MPRQTIFYSWQSDVGKNDVSSDVTKEFIFEALGEALKKIVEEYPELSSVEPDRDTRGLAGTPSLVEAILKKIDESCLFLADLTFVGETADQKPKKLPNPNVMFELGHASNRLGWDRIILVMNTHYGEPSSLPFDINHRRFPIKYHLAPNAGNSRRKSQQKRLVSDLKFAILIAYQDGLFNRYVNEAQVRAAKWIFRTVEKSAHFLFDDIAKELSIDSFQITDLDRIEQVIKHSTIGTFRRINPISSSTSSQNHVPYLDWFLVCLQDFLDKIDKLLFRYTHLGGNLIKSLEEVQFHAIELFDYLQIMENIRTTAIETYDRELQSQAKRLLLEIRQCLIEARTIRNEPIEG